MNWKRMVCLLLALFVVIVVSSAAQIPAFAYWEDEWYPEEGGDCGGCGLPECSFCNPAGGGCFDCGGAGCPTCRPDMFCPSCRADISMGPCSCQGGTCPECWLPMQDGVCTNPDCSTGMPEPGCYDYDHDHWCDDCGYFMREYYDADHDHYCDE